MEVDGTFSNMTKKEISRMQKEQARLERNLGGIKEMKDLPGVMFVVDTRKEAIAIAEANKMKIPVVAIVDTNCNPDVVDLPIPGNDDAIRAINLFTQIVANAVVEAENEVGLEVIETLQDEGPDEYDYDQIIDKDQFGEEFDAPPTPDVETVSLGEMAGAALNDEQAPLGFTDQDYSDYTPQDEPERATPEQETVTDKAGIDEDTLYDR